MSATQNYDSLAHTSYKAQKPSSHPSRRQTHRRSSIPVYPTPLHVPDPQQVYSTQQPLWNLVGRRYRRDDIYLLLE